MTSPPAHSSPRHLPSRLSQGDSLIRSDEAISLPEAFASFKHELRNLPRLWLSIDLRTVATRVGDGWHNVGTRVYLDPREPGLVTRFPRLPGSDDLLILQDVNAIEELDSLLASVAAGAVNAGGESIRFEAFSNDPQVHAKPYWWGVGFSDIASGHARDYVHWSSLHAWGHGSTLADLVGAGGLPRERIEAAVRLGDAPYDGLADLERYFLAKPQPALANTSVGFEIFAPFQVLIDRRRSRLAGGRLSARLTALSSDFLEACTVGFFGLDGSDLPVQQSIRPQTISQDAGTGTWNAMVIADVGETYFAKLMLRVGRWCVDRTVLHDLNRPGKNQRQLAYQVIDPGESLFQEWLFPETPDRDDQFERAVGRLFMMLGYQIDSYAGTRKLGEGVDFLAHEPLRPVLLAVECTTGTPGSRGKIGRLVARARALSGVLMDVEVTPVLVTSLPQENIPRDQLGSAADDGVSLMSREDIANLLHALALNVPVERVTSQIRALVPPDRATVK